MVVKKDGIRHLGDLVRKTRKMAGLTQLELAEMAGIGKTLVFDIEKGHQSIQLINLIKIFVSQREAPTKPEAPYRIQNISIHTFVLSVR